MAKLVYQLSDNPFFMRLEDSQRILLAGAGGGCDIYCGLPLYFALREMGREIHLANLSFTNLYGATGKAITETALEVNADSGGSNTYFPERRLCEWLRLREIEQSVYCFHRTGVKPLVAGYQAIVDEHDIDTVVLVDGGTDSLARGDEAGLGTPEEDMASIAAVDEINVQHKLLTCVGFGIDAFHGICHRQYLEAVAALTRKHAFLGVFSLLPGMAESHRFAEAVKYLCEMTPGRESIVNTSIASAIEGEFGNVHKTDRTQGSELFINPLMAMYWSFELDAVVKRSLYLDKLKGTTTYAELTSIIGQFRQECERKPYQDIPV